MKKKILTLTGLLVILVLVMAACSPQPAPAEEAPQPAAEEPMEEPAPAEEEPAMEEQQPMAEEAPAAEEPMQEESMESEAPAAAAEIDVEALIIEKVAGNHDVERIFNGDFSREEWEDIIDRMIGYGARINEEEKQIIIDYLVNR